MKTFIHTQGTRVRIRRGSFPIDASLIGRNGLVVALSDYKPKRYGVILDGEEAVREFTEDELEAVGVTPGAGRGDPGPTVGPTPSGGSTGQK
jgi:hypothetical protein